MHGRLTSAVLPEFGQEGVEHVLLPLGRGVATKDGAHGFPKDPVDLERVRLDGLLAIDDFSEPQEGGAGGTTHILAHVTNRLLFEPSLLLAQFEDRSIVKNEVVVVELLEALCSEVEGKGSPKGRGRGGSQQSNDILEPGGGPPPCPVCSKRPGFERAAWKYRRQLVVAAPMSFLRRSSLSPVALPLARTW